MRFDDFHLRPLAQRAAREAIAADPQLRERFTRAARVSDVIVLGPLAEIAADMVDPVSKLRVGELLRALLRDESR